MVHDSVANESAAAWRFQDSLPLARRERLERGTQRRPFGATIGLAELSGHRPGRGQAGRSATAAHRPSPHRERRVSWSSELGDRDIVDVLRWIHAGRLTGTLEIGTDDSTKHLHFVAGQHYLSSVHPLARTLASQLPGREPAPAAHPLSGSAAPPAPKSVQHILRRIAEHMTTWDKDAVRFKDGAPITTCGLVGPLPTAELLREASEARRSAALVAAAPAPVADAPQPSTASEDSPAEFLALDADFLAATAAPAARRAAEPSPEQPAALKIWRDHFRLAADPFALTPDPAFLYLSEEHAQALTALESGLRESRGLIVMIGEVGTGKTTVVYSLLSRLDRRIETAYVANTALSFEEILCAALRDFGVTPLGHRKPDLLAALDGFLGRCGEQGKTAALVIDEAQNLSEDALDQLRRLLASETQNREWLRIVLVGQPELGERLAGPRLQQVAERIAVRCHLDPLSPKDARRYVAHRLEAAGGSAQIFTRAARDLLVKEARGFPRRINSLGHNAMLLAYGNDCRRIDRSQVARAVRDKAGKRPAGLLPAGNRPAEILASFPTSRKLWLGAAATVVLVLAAALAWSPATLSRGFPAPSPGAETAAVVATDAPSPSPAAPEQGAGAAEPLAATIAPAADTGRFVHQESARTTTYLRLRTGPGLEHPTIRTLPPDSALEVVDRRGDWLHVRPVEEGWVARRYVTTGAPVSAAESDAPVALSGQRRLPAP